jgi:ApaG protein
MSMYIETTHHINVTVEPLFLEEQSLPLNKHYVWAYSVWIENQGSEMVQLIKRTWRITDAQGITYEIKGEGVVGEKPWIAPGETYHYTSGTPLSTPSGMMEGLYHMRTKEGKQFDVVIPAFSLDSPYETASIH